MNWNEFTKLDLDKAPTPLHLIDLAQLRRNVAIISELQKTSGAKILFALKAFAQHSVFDVIAPHVAGATASSLNEALHAKREFGGELHLCAPAYPPEDMPELIGLCDHIVFNSFTQLERFTPLIEQSFQKNFTKKISVGLRINPEHSEASVELYDPCSRHSRLGVRLHDFEKGYRNYEKTLLSKPSPVAIEGLHFHTLCEQNCAPLERTLCIVEKKFGRFFSKLKWINFGGGHLLTAEDYERKRLIGLIRDFKRRHPQLEVYLEPGEAFVIRTGVLVARVLDIVSSEELPVVILDASAAAHMPDVLEMPYEPEVLGAKHLASQRQTQLVGETINQGPDFSCILAGPTCLAGDVIGRYVFPNPLSIGELVYLLDMSHYTMVKNNNFNGVRTPAIGICDLTRGDLQIVKEFGYEDYRGRLS